jgi:ribosomal protein L11 methyltransferase
MSRKNGAAILQIDPGLAFGSGRHASTFLCLRVLSDLADGGFSPRRILDLGSGSGILALAAALIFPQAAEIIGLDSDAETLPVARANADLNNLSPRAAFTEGPVSQLSPGFDLILSNITLNPLKELALAITELSAPGAKAVLSGLLEDQEEEAYLAYRSLGWEISARLFQEEWSALLLALGQVRAADGQDREGSLTVFRREARKEALPEKL